MAIQLQPSETSIPRIVQSVIQLNEGRSLSIGDVTLELGQTETFVAFVNCSKECRVFLQAQTTAAIAAQARVAPADIVQGGFTIRHLAAGANANFSFDCRGG